MVLWTTYRVPYHTKPKLNFLRSFQWWLHHMVTMWLCIKGTDMCICTQECILVLNSVILWFIDQHYICNILWTLDNLQGSLSLWTSTDLPGNSVKRFQGQITMEKGIFFLNTMSHSHHVTVGWLCTWRYPGVETLPLVVTLSYSDHSYHFCFHPKIIWIHPEAFYSLPCYVRNNSHPCQQRNPSPKYKDSSKHSHNAKSYQYFLFSSEYF